MKKPRVAVTLAGCDFGRSGVGEFARAVIPRLIRTIRERGGEVRVIGTRAEVDGIGTPQECATILPASLDAPGRSALFAMTGLPVLARALGAKALYYPAANRRIPLLNGLPTVGTVHDLAQFHVDNKYGFARELYIRRVLAPTIRRLDRVLSVSEATADDTVRFARVPRDRIRVVYNGISLPPAAKASAGRRRPYVLYACRLEHPGKNHVRLLEAFARSALRDTHDLVLSGKDWGAQARIEEARARLGIEDRVDLVGFISRDELSRLTQDADVVAVAGLFEGFGLPAAEALAFGRPVACSDTGSLPEVVGPLAALFDPHDADSMARALTRAAQDQELRRRCRQEGPDWVRRFSWDRCAEQVAQSLQEVARW